MAVVRYSSTSSFGGLCLSDEDCSEVEDDMGSFDRRAYYFDRDASPVVCYCVSDSSGTGTGTAIPTADIPSSTLQIQQLRYL